MNIFYSMQRGRWTLSPHHVSTMLQYIDACIPIFYFLYFYFYGTDEHFPHPSCRNAPSQHNRQTFPSPWLQKCAFSARHTNISPTQAIEMCLLNVINLSYLLMESSVTKPGRVKYFSPYHKILSKQLDISSLQNLIN